MMGAGSDENQVPLLPICHTTQKAQIEITLDAHGNFRRAKVVSKAEARTVIPCTEKSAGRTSGEAAHPLCDKLQYLAGDYTAHGGEKVSYFDSYAKLLSEWTNKGAPLKVRLIYAYVQRGQVVGDLIGHKILFADTDGRLCAQRPFEKAKNAETDIFDLLPGRVDVGTGNLGSWEADAFVRWTVEVGDLVPEVWKDSEIVASWIDFYSSTKQMKSLCYVTGEESFSADQHPAKIRNDGDKAKLISSGKSASKDGKITVDDGCGFTFLGRFTSPDQAAAVGFETTQKAHFALRWLISRQGYVQDDLAVVAWATSGAKVIQPTGDSFDAIDDDLPSEEDNKADTAEAVALRLKMKIAGYRQELGETARMVVIAVDSATPGRLSIVYYRTLSGSEFLERIERWHEELRLATHLSLCRGERRKG